MKMITQYLANLSSSVHENANKHDNDSCTCNNNTGISPITSGLNCALNFLKQKVLRKDEMITELTEELRQRTNASTFEVIMDTLDDFQDDCTDVPNCVVRIDKIDDSLKTKVICSVFIL